MKTKTGKNVLSGPEMFLVAKAIEGMRGEIDAGKMSAAQVLARLVPELKLELTPANVRHAAKIAGATLYKRMPKRGKKASGTRGGGKYLEPVRQDVAALKAKVQVMNQAFSCLHDDQQYLARRVKEILDALGMK